MEFMAVGQRFTAVCSDQVVVIGKLSQAVVVAAAAYRDQCSFQQLTGIEHAHLIEDSGSWDTQASWSLQLVSLKTVGLA